MNSTLALVDSHRSIVDMTNTSEVIHAIFEKDKVEIAYLLSWMIGICITVWCLLQS